MFILSIDTQMIIVFGICSIFPVVTVLIALPRFYWTRELKLIYAISNIISLIFFSVYIAFLYRKSSPIICSVIDVMLNETSGPIDIFISLIGTALCFALFALYFYRILLFISDIFYKFIKLLCKFIHWLRKK